jgi:hypothetical protein
VIEAARILGVYAAVLLAAAIAAWLKPPRGVALQRLDGRAGPQLRPKSLASQLLVLAAGLSALAAVLTTV